MADTEYHMALWARFFAACLVCTVLAMAYAIWHGGAA